MGILALTISRSESKRHLPYPLFSRFSGFSSSLTTSIAFLVFPESLPAKRRVYEIPFDPQSATKLHPSAIGSRIRASYLSVEETLFSVDMWHLK